MLNLYWHFVDDSQPFCGLRPVARRTLSLIERWQATMVARDRS